VFKGFEFGDPKLLKNISVLIGVEALDINSELLVVILYLYKFLFTTFNEVLINRSQFF
jgi:hypothetical protein